MDSAQEELLTLMKSLIANQAQTKHIVLKDTATNTDSSTLHISLATCTVQADYVDAGSYTDELNENPETATFQYANSSTAFTIPPVSSDSPFFIHKEKHSTKVYDVKTELNLRAGNIVHFTSDVDQSHAIRNDKPYPASSKTLRELQESIIRVNEDFKLDSYICKVNMIHNQGSCNFNPVDFIAENTTCYLMVLGGTCTIESLNTIGPIFPHIQHLKGGDILSISSNSINTLSLSFQSTSSAPVIIIKFFKTSVSAHTPKPKPPPIGMPGSISNAKQDLLLGKCNRRSLFLTDSILKSINPYQLSTHYNERCIKKVMYYLTDFMQFEPEFEYTHTVIISAGINDMCRKRMMPEQICDIVLPQLKRLSEKYAKTVFIVNSVIHADNRQLNTHIDQLNYYLKSGIDSLRNVFFFNSHRVLCSMDGRNIYTDNFGIKMHIHNHAVQNVKRHLITFLKSNARIRADTRLVTR